MKIVGQMVCGPGEADRYLELTLKEFARLCDDVIVATCHATHKEIKLLDKYDFRHYDDDREWGRWQWAIKSDLVARIHRLVPDWILPLDADETLPTVVRRSLEGLSDGKESCYFRVINLWNDEQHYAKELSFWNVRFYKSIPVDTLFRKYPVHPGNAPNYFYHFSEAQSAVPHILLHRGLMDKANRQRKVERYNLYDPHARFKGQQYYDSLLVEKEGQVYNQEKVLKELQDYVARLHA